MPSILPHFCDSITKLVKPCNFDHIYADSKLKETDDGIINRPAMKHVGQPPQYHQSQRMSGRKQNSSSSQSSSFSQKLQQREIIPNSTLNSEDADYNEIVPFDALPTKTRTSTSFSQRFKSFFQTAKSKLNRKTDKKDTFGVENPKPPTDDPDIAILCGYSELESESFHQAKDSVVLPSGKQLQQRNRLPTPTLSEDGLPCITSNNLPLNVQGKPKCLLEGSEIFQKDFLPTTSFAHTISNSSHCLHSFEKVSLVKHSTDNNCASHQNCSANSEYQVAVQPSVMSNSAQYSYLKIPTNSADETYSRPRKISRQHSFMPKTVYNSLSAAAAAGFVPGGQSKHPNNESSHIYCQLHPSTFARSPSSTAGRINHLNEIFHSPFDQSDQPNVIFSSHPRPLGSPLTEEQHSAARLSYQPITAHTPNQSRSHLEDLNAKHIKRTPDQSNRLVPFSLLSARTKSDNRSNKSPRRFSMPWSFPPIYSNDNCTSDQSNQFSNTPPLSLLSVQPEYDIRSAENHLQMTQPTGDRSSNLSTRRFTVPWIVSQKPSKISRPSDTLIPPPNISYYIAPSAQPMSNNRSNQSPRRFSIPWPLSPIHSNIHTPEESNHTFDKPSSSTHSTQ